MALLKDFEIPNTGVVVPNAYHVIVDIKTHKRLADLPPPPDSGRPDGLTAGDRGPEVYWKAGYVGQISIEIFPSKQARDDGKKPIGAIAIEPTTVSINGEVSTDVSDFDLCFFIDPTSQLSIVDQAYEQLKGLTYYQDATEA